MSVPPRVQHVCACGRLRSGRRRPRTCPHRVLADKGDPSRGPGVAATLPERDDQIAHARRNPQPAYRVRPRARGVLHGSRRVMDLAPEVDVNGLNAPSEPVAVHVAAVRVLPRWMVGREGDLAEAECDCLGGRTPSAGGIVMERAHLLRTPAGNRDLRSPFQCRLAGG